MKHRQIFAIADNGFRADPNSTALARHLLASTGLAKPRVLLIPTASGDAQDYLDAFDAHFAKFDCTVSHLSLFRGQDPNFEKLILEQDLIYVTGGNTRNMLTLWRDWKIDILLARAYAQGTVFAGGSAGSLCWFEAGVTDSVPGRFSSLPGLAYLPFSNCPHYNELTRRPYYLSAIETGELGPGFAAENGVALHFINETFSEAVSAYPGKAAFFVEKKNAQALEVPLLVRMLS